MTIFDDSRAEELKLAEIDTNFTKYKEISGDAIKSLQEQVQSINEVS